MIFRNSGFCKGILILSARISGKKLSSRNAGVCLRFAKIIIERVMIARRWYGWVGLFRPTLFQCTPQNAHFLKSNYMR